MNADPTPDDGLLGTPGDCWEVGHGSAAAGEPLDRLLAGVARDYGRLTLWQRQAIIDGWCEGATERDAWGAATRAGIGSAAEGNIPF